jgi:peptide deformylase
MHKVQRPVTEFGPELEALVADMAVTMYAADGVGLAACQVGVDLALFIFDCPDENDEHQRAVVCNPLIRLPSDRQQRLDKTEEGCLSLPGAFVTCARPDYAVVVGQDLRGDAIRIEGTGLLARCLQHETDHCNGTVFGDHLDRRAKRKLFKQASEQEALFPPDWPLGLAQPAERRDATT